MKSFLLAFILLSAGTASVAGLSYGLPQGLQQQLLRVAATMDRNGVVSITQPGGVSDNRTSSEKKGRTVELAQVQDTQVQDAQAQDTQAQESRQQQPVVDESALRYFAARGDTARLNAEIARLRALYPTWTPPENPLAVPENQDRQLEEMWALYSQARYGEVREAIAARQRDDPQWTAPADLLERLDVAEKRAQLIAASNEKRHEDVVRIGAATPSLLTCSDADVLWRVAESFAATDRTQRAKDAYAYMLDNCSDEPIRIATVQKASELLGYADMQDLLTREHVRADGTKEFDAIRNDLARRFAAEGGEEPTLAISPDYLRLVEKLSVEQGLASDALLLGWYYLRRDDNAAAEPHFRRARAVEDSASASQGLALILLARKMPLEAEEVMYAWRTSSDEAMSTYLAATANLLALQPPVKLEGNVLSRIAQVTLETRNPETGEQFGWYALAMNQARTAEEWFDQVLRWKDDYEPAAYGLAVARLRLDDQAGVRAIQQLWGQRSERIARLGETGETARSAGTDATERKAPRRYQPRQDSVTSARVVSSRQAAGCRSTRDARGLAPAAALTLGWCLMEIDRPLEAAQAFEAALSGSGTVRSDAAYGQSLAYLRAGLTSDAAVAATKARLETRRVAELQAAILADRAISSFRARRYRETLVYLDQRAQYRPEPTNLMILRADALKNLGRRLDARRLLEAVAETGVREAIRALADLNNEE